MAKFDFKGSAIDFSRSSYEETGAAINAIDNIYSYAITKNTSSKVSFWGYLYSGQRYSVSLNLSKRSNYSFTAKRLTQLTMIQVLMKLLIKVLIISLKSPDIPITIIMGAYMHTLRGAMIYLTELITKIILRQEKVMT